MEFRRHLGSVNPSPNVLFEVFIKKMAIHDVIVQLGAIQGVYAAKYLMCCHDINIGMSYKRTLNVTDALCGFEL
jgi:hypothetical protein